MTTALTPLLLCDNWMPVAPEPDDAGGVRAPPRIVTVAWEREPTRAKFSDPAARLSVTLITLSGALAAPALVWMTNVFVVSFGPKVTLLVNWSKSVPETAEPPVTDTRTLTVSDGSPI